VTRGALAFAVFLACALPAMAEEPAEQLAEQQQEQEAERPQSLFVAAAWCTAGGPGNEDAPGCDAGMGVSLARFKRLRWVVVVGSTTLGTGIAWVPNQPKGGLVFAVAFGVVTRYDSTGIATDIYPAIGATVGLGRPR
jgi:hypothetical protein